MIGIVDYGMGNISSVYNSLDYLGYEATIINSPEEIEGLTHLIIPGVGSFRQAMQNLEDKKFIAPILNHVKSKKPLLGICLGMQLLATKGYEHGETNGLGLIEGEIIPFEIKLHVPHVGWNNINTLKKHPVVGNNVNQVDFYFVHSYYFNVKNKEDILTMTEYEISFPSIVAKDNIIGIQFHPEKSQEPGLNLLEAFCEWDGKC
jgi:glutamine amidotransferase